MHDDLKTRTTTTASGATAVQVVRYEHGRCNVIKHFGSAHNPEQLKQLNALAAEYIQHNSRQPELFSPEEIESIQAAPLFSRFKLIKVQQTYAREVLLKCLDLCGLDSISTIHKDLAIMRIIEPASKLRTLELLERYFGVVYAQRTMYRSLPKLLNETATIESAALQSAQKHLNETFAMVLYDVTTLYFESFKEYDLQRPGFSKDNKHQQPQIVIGLITTRSGFPLMHQIFTGNTFEGHTMLEVLNRFKALCPDSKPVIVADAAMLSKANMKLLNEQGYQYIVGARLANASHKLIDQIHRELAQVDGATRRYKKTFGDERINTVCQFSEKRYKKDHREMMKQIERANNLLEKNEPGKRAKFIKKSAQKSKSFEFNETLKNKTEKLLGIKGYVTNIPIAELDNQSVINYYHDLWNVEQAFRMSKSDLKTRPIFHHTEDSIRAHVLICFMALMVGKLIEIKTGRSIKRIRDAIWSVQEAHVRDTQTGTVGILAGDHSNPDLQPLKQFLYACRPH